MIRVIELFAGIGSQTQALKNIGTPHEVVAISDNDRFAEQSYKALHGEVNNLGDIRKVDKLPPADLWTYSFPCQDISVAGKGAGLDKGEGTRSGLLWVVERLLRRAQEECELPKYLLLENVKNLIGKNHKANYEKWVAFLSGLGYTTYTKVLNAKDFGVPQNRERVFGVSILGDHTPYEFPNPQPLTRILKDILEDEVDPRFYLKESTMRSMLTSNFTNRRKSVFQPTATHVGSLLSRDYKEPKCVVVGNIEEGKWGKVTEMHQTVFSPSGISPTLTGASGGNQEKKILTEPQIEVVGQMIGGKWETSYNLSRQVYSPQGLAPTQVAAAGQGGNNETKIIVDDLYAGREPRTYEDTAPTLRGERNGLKVVAGQFQPVNRDYKKDGEERAEHFECRDDDVSNAVLTGSRKNCIKVMALRGRNPEDLRAKGNYHQRAEVRKDDLTNTITQVQKDNLVLENCTIRKLTPTECWRLMGWNDEQIAKVKAGGVSNSQMYKQAGNGIVVALLEEIFKNLFVNEVRVAACLHDMTEQGRQISKIFKGEQE